MVIRAYIYHKRAEKYSDCQDCFGVNLQNNRIAISDGMTQSVFPQWWARILVDHYLESGHIPTNIKPLQEKWQKMLISEIQKREEESKTNPKRNPWRLRNSLAEKSGAAATLCGFSVSNDGWNCECIGDSSLIAVDHDYSLKFYTSQVGEFGNHPDYLDSFNNGVGTPVIKSVEKNVKMLLMVSDPIAELFQLNETKPEFIRSRINEILSLTEHTSFIDLVEKWRDELGMHNDDTTLIIIKDPSNNNFTIEYSDNIDDLCSCEFDSENNSIGTPYSQNSENIERNKVKPSGEDRQKAIKRFRKSCRSLLAFCPKKKEENVKDWLLTQLAPTLKRFLNEPPTKLH
ncbi:MAG: hypothetical protein HDS46_02320 [Bacteroides sp.]|nr:hypothetical protein [Bacteroides sp.]